MDRQLLFFLASIQIISALCPYSYTDGGNGYCYKLYPASKVHSEALNICIYDGGRLPYIPNAFVNEIVRKVGASDSTVTRIWVGLTCDSSAPTSCTWDGTKTLLNSTSYTNFKPGYPFYGSNVIMYINGGGWVAATNQEYYAVVCEVPYEVPTGPACEAGYTEYQGHCYKSIAADSFFNAETTCQKDCAELASIHGADENQFITTLAANASNGNIYTRIGLYAEAGSGTYKWTDNSTINYNNFGNGGSNVYLGQCVTLALRNDVVNRGEWVSSKCNTLFPSICKKPLEPSCIQQQPLAPFVCNHTMFLNNNGTIYSPGYPNPYLSNSCIYVITVPKGRAKLNFSAFNLDENSYIELYNDVGDANPFVTLRNTDGYGKTYTSTENEMKMIFNAPNGGSKNQKWQGYFTSG